MASKTPLLDKLKKEVEKELKQIDRGDFVYNLGKRRRFPKVFTDGSVAIDNLQIIKELYRLTYMQSLSEAIKFAIAKQPKRASIPIYDLAKAYESLEDFIFGKDHEGVYSGLLRKLSLEGYLNDATIPSVLVAAEHLYLKGYHIVKRKNKFIVLTPDYTQYMVLNSAQKEEIRDDFYGDTLVNSFLSQATNERERLRLEYVLAPPTAYEKAIFQPPASSSALISTLSEFSAKHATYGIESIKLGEKQSTATLKESKKRITFISYKGRKSANYRYALTDLLENILLSFFSDEYGFMFVRPYPHTFIVGPDGYIVSKAYLINNRLAEDIIDYYPVRFSVLMKAVTDELSNEYAKQLRRELSDYALIKFGLGKSFISIAEQKIEPATKTIYNFIHGRNALLEQGWYGIGEKHIPSASGTNLLLSAGDFVDIATSILDYGSLQPQYKKFFGIDELALETNENDVINLADSLSLSKLPIEFLTNAASFKFNGKRILEGDVAVYEDVLSKTVETSGLPLYDKITIQIKNRIILFSVLSRLAK